MLEWIVDGPASERASKAMMRRSKTACRWALPLAAGLFLSWFLACSPNRYDIDKPGGSEPEGIGGSAGEQGSGAGGKANPRGGAGGTTGGESGTPGGGDGGEAGGSSQAGSSGMNGGGAGGSVGGNTAGGRAGAGGINAQGGTSRGGSSSGGAGGVSQGGGAPLGGSGGAGQGGLPAQGATAGEAGSSELGGAASAGASQGGTSSGGIADGGVSEGGATDGGNPGSGGAAEDGGAPQDGGASSGGATQGGSGNGGLVNGGAPEGGAPEGGAPEGGTGNGGTPGGGGLAGGDGFPCANTPAASLITDFSTWPSVTLTTDDTWTSADYAGSVFLYGNATVTATIQSGALRLVSNDLNSGEFAGFGMIINGCYSASSFTGLTASLTGSMGSDARLGVQLQTNGNSPISVPKQRGACKYSSEEEKWNECQYCEKPGQGLGNPVQIPFSEFTNGCIPVSPVDGSEIIGIQFQFTCGNSNCGVDVTLDNLGFY